MKNNFQYIKSIEFDVSGNCNLDCKYCYFKFDREERVSRDNYLMSKDIVNTFFEKYLLSNNDIEKLNISFWGGEPLLNFDVVKYIVEKSELIAPKNSLNFLIVTNGTLINKEVAEFCSHHNVTLQITIDGDRECHDTQRAYRNGHGTYDLIINNIKLLNDYGVKFYIRTTLTSQTPEISTIVNTLKKNNVKRASFAVIFPVIGCDYENLLIEKSAHVAEEIVSNFIEERKKGSGFEFDNIERIIKQFYSKFYYKTCGVSKNKIAIKYDGTVYPCHRFVGSSEYCIGNVSEGMNNIYCESYNDSIKNNKSCLTCAIASSFCGGTCFYEILKRKDNQYNLDENCIFQILLTKKTIKMLLALYRTDRIEYESILNDFLGFVPEYPVLIKNNYFKQVVAMAQFRKSVTAGCIELDDEGILYSTDKFDKKIIANTTAMAIWDLLDGQRTVQQIAQEIANVCEVEFEAIKDDIYGQLAAFQELGLVEEIPTANHA